MPDNKRGAPCPFDIGGDNEITEDFKICDQCSSKNYVQSKFCLKCGNNIRFTEPDLFSEEEEMLCCEGNNIAFDDDYLDAESLEVFHGESHFSLQDEGQVKDGSVSDSSIYQAPVKSDVLRAEASLVNDSFAVRSEIKEENNKVAISGDEVYEVRMALVPFRTTAEAHAYRKRKSYKTFSSNSGKNRDIATNRKYFGNEKFYNINNEGKEGEKKMSFEKEDDLEKEANPVLNQTLKKTTNLNYGDLKKSDLNENSGKKEIPEEDKKYANSGDAINDDKYDISEKQKNAFQTLYNDSDTGKKESLKEDDLSGLVEEKSIHSSTTPVSASDKTPSEKQHSSNTSPTNNSKPASAKEMSSGPDQLLSSKKKIKKESLIRKLPGLSSKAPWKRSLSVLYYLAILFLILMAIIRRDFVTIFLIVGFGFFFIGLYGLIVRIIRKNPFRFYALALMISFVLLFIGDALQPGTVPLDNGFQVAPEEDDIGDEAEDIIVPEIPEPDPVEESDDDMIYDERESPPEDEITDPIEDTDESHLHDDPDDITEPDPADETDIPDEPELPDLPDHGRDTSRSILFD